MIFLGIDGGATSTQALITNERGEILSRAEGERSGYPQHEEGLLVLKKALRDSAKKAYEKLEKRKPIRGIGIGLTGIVAKEPADVDKVRGVLENFFEYKSAYVHNDMRIAFEGATALGTGVLVYGGTGSNTYARGEEGKIVDNVGGWGPLIDDEGGAYVIGKKCLKSAARSFDGRGEKTSLEKRVLDHFSSNSFSQVQRVLFLEEGLGKRDKIGKLAEIVTEESDAGDPVAQDILMDTGKELGLLAATAAKELGCEGPEQNNIDIFFSGGVFQSGPLLLTTFKDYVKEKIGLPTFKKPALPPVQGAILLAMKNEGLELTEAMLNNLKQT